MSPALSPEEASLLWENLTVHALAECPEASRPDHLLVLLTTRPEITVSILHPESPRRLTGRVLGMLLPDGSFLADPSVGVSPLSYERIRSEQMAFL